MAEVSSLPVIDAREIMERIEKGEPVIYDHVAIMGDIDISRLDLPFVHSERSKDQSRLAQVVSSSIQIRNCEILGRVSFANAILREPLDLCGSIFHQEVSCKGTAFKESARFEAACFKRYASFRDSRFSREARFGEAHFSAIANFGGALFHCPASFGSASFSELCANFGEAVFQRDADFTGASFPGTANFNHSTFGESASFWKARFDTGASFQGTGFTGYASFQGAILSGNADFRGARFQEDLNMGFARFQGDAVFIGSCVAGNANFSRTQFGDVNFLDVVVKGDIQFSRAVFGRATFTGSQLKGNSSWQGSSFLGDAAFDGALLSGKAIFSGSSFQANAGFAHSCFQEDALFDRVAFRETADFSGAQFENNLSLASARIHNMRLIDVRIFGMVSLHDAEFTRLKARWPSLFNHLMYDGEAYLSLIRNFKNLEWFEDADDCYYHYRRKSQMNKSFISRTEERRRINWSKILDALAWISCGYGVRPRYTVFLSCFIIILFAFLYWQGMGIVVEPLNGSDYIQSHNQGLTFLDNLYFSSMVFTAKTQVKWYPVGIYRYLATIESILGWLLLALFLVSLGRTMIR